MKTRIRSVLCLVALLAVTASVCGSLVKSDTRGAARTNGFDPETGLATDDSVALGADGTEAISNDGTTQGARNAAGPARRTTPGGGVGSRLPNPPGVTDTTISIGLTYAENATAVNSALGANNINKGDQQAFWEILINDVNKRGGVAGRKLVPVYRVVDPAGGAISTQAQAACVDWTQDHRVFAVLAGTQFLGARDILLQCLQNAGVPAVNDDAANSSAATFARFAEYAELSAPNIDRVAAATVPALSAQRYFAGWDVNSGQAAPVPVKVGVLAFDDDDSKHAVQSSLLAALAKAGHSNVETLYVSPSFQETGSQTSNVVLKFHQEGVTHAIIFDSKSTLTRYFLTAAEAQHYYPRYGFSTNNGAQYQLSAKNIPATQLKGAVGFGWWPITDLLYEENPDTGPYSNDARRSCIKLMKANGQPFASGAEESVALLSCNMIRFFIDALRISGGSLTPRSLFDGLNKTASSFESSITFSTFFDAKHHDGAASARHLVFVPACTCMRYTTGTVRLS